MLVSFLGGGGGPMTRSEGGESSFYLCVFSVRER